MGSLTPRQRHTASACLSTYALLYDVYKWTREIIHRKAYGTVSSHTLATPISPTPPPKPYLKGLKRGGGEEYAYGYTVVRLAAYKKPYIYDVRLKGTVESVLGGGSVA